MTDDRYIPFRHGAWRGRVHRDHAALFADADPMQAIERLAPTTVRQRPSMRLLRVTTPGGEVYAKHLTQANAWRAASRNPLDRLRWVLGGSRVERVQRTCVQLAAAGLCAPRVVLAARRRRGLHAEELLVNLAVPGPTLKEALAAARDRPTATALLRRAAVETHRLHAAGFLHGDLLPANMILTDDDRVCFVDNDRTRCAARAARRGWRRNVAQMALRLVRNNGNRAAMIFLHAYMTHRGEGEAATRRALAGLLRDVRRRNARHSRSKTPPRRIARHAAT